MYASVIVSWFGAFVSFFVRFGALASALISTEDVRVSSDVASVTTSIMRDLLTARSDKYLASTLPFLQIFISMFRFIMGGVNFTRATLVLITTTSLMKKISSS